MNIAIIFSGFIITVLSVFLWAILFACFGELMDNITYDGFSRVLNDYIDWVQKQRRWLRIGLITLSIVIAIPLSVVASILTLAFLGICGAIFTLGGVVAAAIWTIDKAFHPLYHSFRWIKKQIPKLHLVFASFR